MKDKTYGGYLPIETYLDKDAFSHFDENQVARTNSGKTALYLAIKAGKIDKIAIPYYLCGSVKKVIENHISDITYFYLDSNLMPALDFLEEDRWLLAVNYYGMMEKKVNELNAQFPKLILDHAHGFYAPPVLKKDVYNIYSCKKFFGVPDGGYLVGENLPSFDVEEEKIHEHFSYLVTNFEEGTQKAYQEKLDADVYLDQNFRKMSRLTQHMMTQVKYDRVLKKRVDNAQYLHQLLKEYNELKVEDLSQPLFVYPFLNREGLKKELVDRKIFVPSLWREVESEEFRGTLEYEISKKCCFLPIDQRYDKKDMEYIAQTVKQLIRK